MKQPITTLVKKLEQRPVRLDAPAHRVNHGGTAWSAPDLLRQPQDGAVKKTSRLAVIGARVQRGWAGTSALFQPGLEPGPGLEPEDARLTGGTRSLMRRMMGLNIAVRKLPLSPTVAAAKRLA